MKILVTGGAGFIGSTIVDGYIARGHRVVVYDNLFSGKRGNLNPKAHFVRGDVRRKLSLEKVFKKHRFDVVSHHAAQMDVRRSVENPVLDAEINLIGILNVLTLSVQYKVKKVLFSSSGGTVYGECTRPALESDKEIPLSPYGVAKLASEKYIKAFSHMFGLNYTIFRYSNVYGPRQDPHGEAGVVAIFAKKLLSQQAPFIFGRGVQTRDFVYVGDVAAANIKALTKGHRDTFNIGVGQETSIKQLHRTMADLLGEKTPPILKPARTGELSRSVLNWSHAKRKLGWRPSVSLREGISQTLDYFAVIDR